MKNTKTVHRVAWCPPGMKRPEAADIKPGGGYFLKMVFRSAKGAAKVARAINDEAKRTTGGYHAISEREKNP